MKKDKPTPFTVLFFDAIKKMKNDSLSSIYRHLFNLLDKERLEWELQHTFEISEGEDSYFKEYGKNEWFAIFHKMLRQTDFFEGCYQKKKVELVTDEERKEFKFLVHKVREKGFDKEAGREEGQLFNNEYRRYLDLHNVIRRETEEESISGVLDSILWNTIWMDNENELYNAFLRMFSEYKLEKVQK